MQVFSFSVCRCRGAFCKSVLPALWSLPRLRLTSAIGKSGRRRRNLLIGLDPRLFSNVSWTAGGKFEAKQGP